MKISHRAIGKQWLRTANSRISHWIYYPKHFNPGSSLWVIESQRQGARDWSLALPTCHFSCSVFTCKLQIYFFASILQQEDIRVYSRYSLLTNQIAWCLFLGNTYSEWMWKDLSYDKMTNEIHCWEIKSCGIRSSALGSRKMVVIQERKK